MWDYRDATFPMNLFEDVEKRFLRRNTCLARARNLQPANELRAASLAVINREDSEKVDALTCCDLDTWENGERPTWPVGRRSNRVVVLERLMIGDGEQVDVRVPGVLNNVSGIAPLGVNMKIDLEPTIATRAVG